MAYNIIPKSEIELAQVNEKSAGLLPLYRYIVKRSGFNEPFSFDKKYPDRVKLVRAFINDIDVKAWSLSSGVKIEFGNGSRGKGGVNKGIEFEGQFHTDLINYISDGESGIKNESHKQPIKDLEALVPAGYFMVNATLDGGLNKKRETNITKSGVKTSAGNVDIGHIVTDITLELAKKDSGNTKTAKKMYLSLKSGGTVSFINLGIKTMIKAEEIQSGEIKTKSGKELLELFGIDNKKFCDIFNTYDVEKSVKAAPKHTVDVSSKLKNNQTFNEFLKSVIGYGYIMVHKMGRKVYVFEMDEAKMNSFIKVNSAKIEYPKDGTAKRIDIKIELAGMSLNINIRSSDGGIYPSHIFANYTIHH